ncbi:alcohol acetyltransferase [Tuber indicum]|nr:alcohol acetyltransferase [Tuber indicum]
MEDIAETLRALGPYERYSTTRHTLNLYNNVGLTAHYTLPPPLLAKPRIFSALKALINLHPPLAVTILGENTREPRFARLKSIDLEEIVQTILLPGEDTTAELDTVLSEQHSRGFELGRVPGWRCLIFRDYEDEVGGGVAAGEGGNGGVWISFIYHHAIADGVSGLALHKSLLTALSRPHKNPTFAGRYVVHPQQKPYPSSLESLIPLPLSLPHIVSEVWSKVYFPPPPPPTLYTGGPTPACPTPETTRTVYKSLHFSARTLKTLLSVSRRENTTITSLLAAIIATAIFQAIPGKFDKLTSSTPINLRRYVPTERIQEVAIGAYVASLRSEYSRSPPTPSNLFSIAREHTAQINDRLDAGTADLDVGMLRWVSDLFAFFKGKLGKQREDSFAVSNVGAWDGEAGLDRVVFSQSGGVIGAAMEWCVVGVRGGGLVLGCTGCEGAVDTRVLKRVLEGVRRGVEGVE